MTGRHRRRKGRRPRKVNTRTQRKRFLIVCEGEKTEPNYFRSFRVNAEVRISGEGKNTRSLVRAARRLQEEEGPFDEVWVVFDRDDFSADHFNAAVGDAQRVGFHAAWSNQCFELWYLLHFQFFDGALHRSQLIERLKRRIVGGYRKNDPYIYRKLLSNQEDAIRNARRLVNCHDADTAPGSADPCTHVQDLVVALNAHLKV